MNRVAGLKLDKEYLALWLKDVVWHRLQHLSELLFLFLSSAQLGSPFCRVTKANNLRALLNRVGESASQ